MNDHTTFISRIHAYIRSARTTRRGALVRPGEARTGVHKEYPRMPRIALPAPAALTLTLGEALRQRTSCSECSSDRAFSPNELGTLLGSALGMRDAVRRHYPSGGALYPIETYLIGNVLIDRPSGIFHYHPKAHALEFLWETPATFSMTDILRAPYLPPAPSLVVFTSVWSRSSIKYGDFAYSHGLIETGHMAENILLAATALRIGARPVSGCDDRTIIELLDLDEQIEQPVYSVLLCPPQDKQIPEKEERERENFFE